MVGHRELVLEEILTEEQIHHVLYQAVGGDSDLKRSEVKPATDGITGYFGDHIRAVLHVNVQGIEKKVHLFMKRVPKHNQPKAEYIDTNNFFRREEFMYKLLEELCVNDWDQNPWCVRAYIYTDSIIVMPDLKLEGYAPRHYLNALDFEHSYVTTASIAHFHAAFVNYETKKSIELKRPYSTNQEYLDLLREKAFYDCPWIRSAAKLSADFLKEFSTKTYRNIPDLESKLTKLYIEACDSLTEYKDTLNVIIHRDLWVNNMLFKHENGVPTNAVIVDYQCIRYGPPAFDLISFLYLTTDKSFREKHEKDILGHYYSVFSDNLNVNSKQRLNAISYNKNCFLKWCEKARMFGMLLAIVIYPFILMDPKVGQKTFDDPETYDKYMNQDRSEPVIAHANTCEVYKRRQLALTEEFVETYVLKQL